MKNVITINDLSIEQVRKIVEGAPNCEVQNG